MESGGDADLTQGDGSLRGPALAALIGILRRICTPRPESSVPGSSAVGITGHVHGFADNLQTSGGSQVAGFLDGRLGCERPRLVAVFAQVGRQELHAVDVVGAGA